MNYFLYFDPGLGALILQALAAAVAGVILFSKNVMYKIKAFLGLNKSEGEELFDDINVKDSEVEQQSKKDK